MKTNFLTKKQKSFILELSNEIKRQDNLATVAPYVILNTQNRVQIRPDTHATDYALYLDFETVIHSKDELFDFLKDDYPNLRYYVRDNLSELQDFLELTDIEGSHAKSDYDALKNYFDDMSIVFYEEELETSKNDINVFFTHKAYEKHIEANAHHYNKPKKYLKGLFRNPEMEGVLDVIHTLAHAIQLSVDAIENQERGNVS